MVFGAVILTCLLSFVIYTLVTQRLFVSLRTDEYLASAQSISSMLAEAEDGVSLAPDTLSPLFSPNNPNLIDADLFILDGSGNIVFQPQNRTGRDAGGRQESAVPPAEPGGAPDNAGNEPPSPSGEPDAAPAPSGASQDMLDGEGPAGIPEDILRTVFEAVSSGEDFSGRLTSGTDGTEYLVVGVPVMDGEKIAGAVILSKRTAELSQKLDGLNITLIVGAILSLIILIAPVIIATRKLASPINQIRDVSRAMSKGDYSIRANENQKGEIGELARSINEFAAASEQLEQVRRDYIANVSHEMRTPISSIRALSETLMDGLVESEEDKLNYYENIRQESMRLGRLVNDMLELSRLQGGVVALEKSYVDAGEILSGVMSLYGRLCEEAGLSLVLDAPEDLSHVYSNADRIKQVLIILLDNAVKHTPGGGRVAMCARNATTGTARDASPGTPGDSAPGWVEISVRDTGGGIPPEHIGHVFERFYQSDKSHSSEGTGLGLSIAREVLKMMGEEIWVESEPGKGSAFTFTLHAE